MTGCCGDRSETGRLTVHGCFDRGLATRRLPALATVGERVIDAQGLWAAFSVSVHEQRLTGLRFQACSCTTLIAYCQAVCELLRGRSLAQASAFDAARLVARLPGVPRQRHDRAVLALAALRAALVARPAEPRRTKEKME